MPMFFAVAGIGIAEGARLLRPGIDRALDWLAGHSLAPRARSAAVALVAAFVVGFAAIGNGVHVLRRQECFA